MKKKVKIQEKHKPEHDMEGYRYLVEGDVILESDETLVDVGWTSVGKCTIGKEMKNLTNGHTKFFRRQLGILTDEEFDNLLEIMKGCTYITPSFPSGVRMEIENDDKTGDLVMNVCGLEKKQSTELVNKFNDWLTNLIKELELEEKEDE